MIRPLLLGTVLLVTAGCAPRLSTTHFDRWAKQDLARRSETPAPAEAGAALPTPPPAAPAAPAAPSPTPPPESSDYPDEPSSGTNGPDASSEGRVVKPTEEDEVLY